MRQLKFKVWGGESFFYSESCLGFIGSENNNNLQLRDFFEFVASEFCKLPEHILQFTGLLDIKGKETYEGDIVKMLNKSLSDWPYLVVEFEEARYVGKAKGSMFCYLGACQFEVIGNIFENPELLL